MPLKQNFRTSDICLGAVLKISKFRLLGLERNGNKAVFVFQDKPERPEIVMRLVNREMSVEPLRFMEEIRNLKSLTH
jgi:D-Tyr-tRNAtyr deacylase